MDTNSNATDRDPPGLQTLEPGRLAGRMVDGVDMIIDGVPAGRRPPRWERKLAMMGCDLENEGPITFGVVCRDTRVRAEFSDVRSALRAARAAVETGADPRDVTVEAMTATGGSVTVVTGRPIVGMAIGALEDPPITVIEGPSVLPRFPPGERPAKRARSRRGGSSRG